MNDCFPASVALVYINLDDAVERKRRMQAQFASLGLGAERLSATRWTLLARDQQDRWYSPQLNAATYFRPLLPGEQGCYLSHIRAWEQLLESPFEAMVVLEDDVTIEPTFTAVIGALAGQHSDWDMVKLLGREHERPRRSTPLPCGHALIEYRRIPSLTAGYMINREGARKLLASRVPFGRPVDVDLRHWWESRLVVRGVLPFVLAHDDTSEHSSVGEKTRDGDLRDRQADLRSRWKKFAYKLRYSLHNWAAG